MEVNMEKDHPNHNEVNILIDNKKVESPNPTTGVALYALAHILSEKELFREVQGDNEDVPIPRNEDKIHLKMYDHFYSEKEFKIIVNTREKIVTEKELSFDEIVSLAFENPPSGPNILFTITYRKGPHKNPEGSLLEGGTVKIKKGMVFNVIHTNKS
jgi:hypothetical protein